MELLKYDSLSEQGNIANLNLAPVKVSDTHPAPPSVGGIGASAGAINSVNAIDLRNQDQSYNGNGNGNQFPGTANAAPSVAGSGISPSAHKQSNEVDLQNPQTALHDPHLQKAIRQSQWQAVVVRLP